MMQNYKDINNKVHVIDSDNFEYLLPKGCVKITQEEADILNKPKPETTEQIIARLQVELDVIEFKALMPRGAREAFIVLCEQQAAAAGLTPAQAYQVNPFYKGLKDTDNACIALRAQIRDLT
jgi:hypothetical protein